MKCIAILGLFPIVRLKVCRKGTLNVNINYSLPIDPFSQSKSKGKVT